VFAEEVEAALKLHDAVYDCVVAGRPSEHWGSEVVAIVRLRDGWTAGPQLEGDLLACAGERIAGFKRPKAFVYVEEVVRAPSGKPDYRWARDVAARAQSHPD
jgi:fatty-acyl-CoA synthase